MTTEYQQSVARQRFIMEAMGRCPATPRAVAYTAAATKYDRAHGVPERMWLPMKDRWVSDAIEAYVDTAIWLICSDDEPMSPFSQGAISVYMKWGIPDDVKSLMASDVRTFVADAEGQRADAFEGLDAGHVGQDFFLTRNRHGAGFWDRGLGERGDFLTDVAHMYGEIGLSVSGKDGQIFYE